MSRSLDPVGDAAFILADKVRAERDEALEALRAIVALDVDGWTLKDGETWDSSQDNSTMGTRSDELEAALNAARSILSKHTQPKGGAT